MWANVLSLLLTVVLATSEFGPVRPSHAAAASGAPRARHCRIPGVTLELIIIIATIGPQLASLTLMLLFCENTTQPRQATVVDSFITLNREFRL